MGASASALTPDRQKKLMDMTETDRIKLQTQVDELISDYGLSEAEAVQRMIEKFERLVDNEYAWGLPGTDVIRRDSIYDSDDDRHPSNKGSPCRSRSQSNASASRSRSQSKADQDQPGFMSSPKRQNGEHVSSITLFSSRSSSSQDPHGM